MAKIQTAPIREPTRRRQSTTAPRSGTYEGESREVAHRRNRSLPQIPRDYLDRRELLALVPLSMSSIDALEKKGAFPSRFVLSPTVKVCWKRREVIQFLEQRAAKRVHAGHLAAAKQEGAP
jgi:predicted DNA-binding transcriptional regulator AlpA